MCMLTSCAAWENSWLEIFVVKKFCLTKAIEEIILMAKIFYAIVFELSISIKTYGIT